MHSLNPFARKTIPYHRISKESAENDSDGDGQSSSFNASAQPQKERDEGEDNYLLSKQLYKQPCSQLRHTCCYFFVALLSLVIGLALGEILRLEYEIDGYIGAFLPHFLDVLIPISQT
jgi:hypothetical protein